MLDDTDTNSTRSLQRGWEGGGWLIQITITKPPKYKIKRTEYGYAAILFIKL